MRNLVKPIFVIAVVLTVSPIVAAQEADLVVVDKSDSRLHLERNGKRIASFKVAFGGNSKGHKQQEGDQRTPEGRYVLDYKNAQSGYHKSIHVSYPNSSDISAAKARGVSPGGQVMIHGQKNGFGWLAPIARLDRRLRSLKQ
jgi:murein L,D-transpeptidase YafK